MKDKFKLSELKSFKNKYDYLISVKGLEELQTAFFSKKTVIKSLDLIEFFKDNYFNNIKFEKEFFIIADKISAQGKEISLLFDYRKQKSSILFPVINDKKIIGLLFLPYTGKLSDKLKELIFYFKTQIENKILQKDLESRLYSSNKELNDKLLEIESLIDITEIIDSQEGVKENLFQNILVTIISILNASKGMILLKDEKSGFFSVISQFNILGEELPKKIVRITKGILKDLNNDKRSKIIDETQKYELLKSSKKNCVVSPIISSGIVEGVILLFDKESRNGLVRFTQQDLRLFDSLVKKLSLAYDNIR